MFKKFHLALGLNVTSIYVVEEVWLFFSPSPRKIHLGNRWWGVEPTDFLTITTVLFFLLFQLKASQSSGWSCNTSGLWQLDPEGRTPTGKRMVPRAVPATAQGKDRKHVQGAFPFLRNRAAAGKGQDNMCDQTPTCVLSTRTNTLEVMHTPYPQRQNHLLSTKPILTSGQGRKITHRHTHTLTWDLDKQARCPKLSPLAVTDCRGLLSGLS